MFKKLLQLTVSMVFTVASFQVAAAPIPVKEVLVKTVDLTQEKVNQDKGKLTAVAKAPNKESLKAAEQLIQRLEKVNSLSASFEQTSISQDGRLKTESGQMQLKRPSLIRWRTLKPYETDIVANGSKVWMIDHDLQQVIVQKQDERLSNTPAQLLTGGAKELLAKYQVSVFKSGQSERYTLLPVGASDVFEKLEIVFDKGMLASMELKDNLGGKRQILFSSIQKNHSIKDDVFAVSTPKGYELFDETRM